MNGMNDSSPAPCSPWRVFEMNDYDWMVARSPEEAANAYREITGCDYPEDGEEPIELGDKSLDRLQFADDGHNAKDWTQWVCECGAVGDANCRYVDGRYEHHHCYPMGHVAMTCTTKRSFRDELARRVAAGLSSPQFFASTEV